MPAVSTLYHDRHRAALSYTVRAVSYWNCATSTRCACQRRDINPAPPVSSQPSAQLVCTLCIIHSMRNANHLRPTSHWCTSVKAALKLAKQTKTSLYLSLTIFPIRSDTTVSALQMSIPVVDSHPPSWKRYSSSV
jgi:hypothetical protein